MNAYKVVLRYVDTLGEEDYSYTVFGRNEDDAIWAAKDALRGEINFEGDWNDDPVDAAVMTIEMIDPESIL
jgi:hypothetical protein